MASFTPQQLSGQKGYRHRTFIGNWNEDVQYQEDQMRDYLTRREKGGLLSQKIGAKVKAHATPVALPPLRGDGWVHFGDCIMLQCAATDAFLSADVDDQLAPPPEEKYGVTTANAQGPLMRNTWQCVKLPCGDDPYWEEQGQGDVLHYGQKFRLQLNPDLCPGREPYRLLSEKMTPSCYSKVTKQQEVSAAGYGTMQTNWQVLFANPEFRFEMEGQPVKANTVVVLSHCATGQFLSSDKKPLQNDFGWEWEVCAQKAYALKTKHKEAPELPCNRWALITGLAPDDEDDEAAGGAEPSPAADAAAPADDA